MPESILERLRAKAWGEDGPHRKRAVHLEVAVAAVREAGAKCDAEITTARHALLDARLEVTALRAENARLRAAGIVALRALLRPERDNIKGWQEGGAIQALREALGVDWPPDVAGEEGLRLPTE